MDVFKEWLLQTLHASICFFKPWLSTTVILWSQLAYEFSEPLPDRGLSAIRGSIAECLRIRDGRVVLSMPRKFPPRRAKYLLTESAFYPLQIEPTQAFQAETEQSLFNCEIKDWGEPEDS